MFKEKPDQVVLPMAKMTYIRKDSSYVFRPLPMSA